MLQKTPFRSRGLLSPTQKFKTLTKEMVSLCNATLSLKQLQLAPTSTFFVTRALYSRTKSLGLNFDVKYRKRRLCVLNSGGESSSVGLWEGPDDEYDDGDSDEEDEEEECEENESDWEEENAAAAATANNNNNNKLSKSKYEGELRKEVEQLLSPEEKAILEQNETPDLEKLSTAKWNPLHTFALAGQIPFMDGLLANGFDVDMIDKDGLTALHHAIMGKKEAVISHLLRKGANPQVRDLDGATPLHYAVQVGAMQTVKLLIKYKVDVNIADNEGWTPLHVAVQSRNRHIVKILLVNGADKTRRNKDGKTALDLSICYGKDFKSYDLAKLLKVLPANREL